MSIQKIVSEISRKIGNLELVQYSRSNSSVSKAKDLLAGIYISDGCIEIRGITGTEISLVQDRFFSSSKIDENIYRFSHGNLEVLIRSVEY